MAMGGTETNSFPYPSWKEYRIHHLQPMIKQISLWDRVRKRVGFGMNLQTLAEDDEIVVIVGFFDLMGFTK